VQKVVGTPFPRVPPTIPLKKSNT